MLEAIEVISFIVGMICILVVIFIEIISALLF